MPDIAIAIAALIAVPVLAQPFLERLARRMPPDHWFSDGVRILRRQFPMLLLLTGLLMLMILESVVLDHAITDALGLDFTPAVHSAEGGASGWLQSSFQNDVLDIYFYAMYMVLFVVLFYGTVIYFMAVDKGTIVKRLVVGYCIIYAIALPFFLLFPVNEVWTTNAAYAGYNAANGIPAYGYTDIHGVLYDMGATNLDASYSFSSIDNCFPSLHTAISVFVPLVVLKGRERLWGAFAAWVGVSVVLATMYLGVHWLIDVGAGLALGVSAWAFVSKFELAVDYPFKVRSMSLGRWRRAFGGSGDGEG
ncbi:MAG: phosphatase PAP2 family protein [Methanobacteriota archaeon]